jgi:hypothetical protein
MFRLYIAIIRLNNFIEQYINVRRDFVPTILLYCIIVFLIYGSMLCLMMAIYSRNMQLICTEINLWLDCVFASFLFSLFMYWNKVVQMQDYITMDLQKQEGRLCTGFIWEGTGGRFLSARY